MALLSHAVSGVAWQKLPDWMQVTELQDDLVNAWAGLRGWNNDALFS